jgi:hypothetical protein
MIVSPVLHVNGKFLCTLPGAARKCDECRDLQWRLPVAVHDEARISRGFPFRTAG